MGMRFTIGGENEFTLLPEAPRVKVRLESVEPSQYNNTSQRWCFLINDPDYANGDSEDVDAAIQQASEDGIQLYQSVNLPKGPKIGKRTKLYQYLAGMAGREIAEDEEIDLDDYVPGDYLADIEVVDKMAPQGDGSFRPAKGEDGKTLKKNAITKLRPIAKRKSGAKASARVQSTPASIPDDDSDLDEDEVD